MLVGPPGSGKGTQGKVLGVVPGFLHLSMGDVFRSLDRSSKLGKVFTAYSSRGELVPDDVTIGIWRDYVAEMESAGRYNPAKHIMVLDGVPRNVAQAELLDSDIDVLMVIHLTTDDGEGLVRRLRRRALKENRVDDAREDVIRRRLAVYKAETQPLLAHYPAGVVTAIDADGTPAEVLGRILARLAPVQREKFGNVLEGVARA